MAYFGGALWLLLPLKDVIQSEEEAGCDEAEVSASSAGAGRTVFALVITAFPANSTFLNSASKSLALKVLLPPDTLENKFLTCASESFLEDSIDLAASAKQAKSISLDLLLDLRNSKADLLSTNCDYMKFLSSTMT